MNPPREHWERHDGPATKRMLKHIILHAARYSYSWPAKNEQVCAIIRKWRDAWAKDMREADRHGEAPADGGDAWWTQNMANAEAEMVQTLGPLKNQEQARVV
jgi:hypothetical protein